MSSTPWFIDITSFALVLGAAASVQHKLGGQLSTLWQINDLMSRGRGLIHFTEPVNYVFVAKIFVYSLANFDLTVK